MFDQVLPKKNVLGPLVLSTERLKSKLPDLVRQSDKLSTANENALALLQVPNITTGAHWSVPTWDGYDVRSHGPGSLT